MFHEFLVGCGVFRMETLTTVDEMRASGRVGACTTKLTLQSFTWKAVASHTNQANRSNPLDLPDCLCLCY